MELTLEQTHNILQTLLENGYVTVEDIDIDPREQDDLAKYWIGEAEKAYEQDPQTAKNDEAIKTILHLSPNGTPVSKPRENFFSGVLGIDPNLPLPHETNFKKYDLPEDYTTLDEKEIRKLSSHYQTYLNRVRWMLAMSSNHLAAAVHLRDDAYRKAYKENHEAISRDGERPTKDLVDAYAREDDAYKKYDADVMSDQEEVTSYKALVEIYSGVIDRLSREATLRHNEWERNK